MAQAGVCKTLYVGSIPTAASNFDRAGAMIRPSRFSHAVLASFRAKELMAWYLAVTNGHVIFENDALAFMTFDGEHHRLGIVQLPGSAEPVPPVRAKLSHLAFAYDAMPELIATYRRLRDRGIYPRTTVNHGLTLSNYYQDPDGNGVELLVDLLPPEEATAMMLSPAFAANPVGLVIDPEALARRVDAGVTAAELTAEYQATPVDPVELRARIVARQALSDAEYAAQFEAELAATP